MAPEDLAVQHVRQILMEKASRAAPGSEEQQRLHAKLALSDDALLDDLYSHIHPNPDRVGCPPRSVLIALAQRTRPLTDPWWEHLLECAPCRIDVRALSPPRAPRVSSRGAWTIAALVLLGVGVAVWWLLRR
jgi:hypothetical protein